VSSFGWEKNVIRKLPSYLAAFYVKFVFTLLNWMKIADSATLFRHLVCSIFFSPLRIKGYRLFYGSLAKDKLSEAIMPDDPELIKALEQFIYSSPNYYYSNNPPVYFRKQPESCTLLRRAKVIGESNISINEDGGIIFPFEVKNSEARFVSSEAAIFAQNDDSFLLKYYPASVRIETGISLLTNLGFNYYHFMVEGMTKFIYLSVLRLPADIPLLVDEVVAKVPQFTEIMSYFNKEFREIIYIKKGVAIQVEQLYYLPCINFIPPNYKDPRSLKAEDTYFNVESLKFLRNTMLNHTVACSLPTRFFLKRSASAKVRKYNENEVIEIAKKIGLEIIDTAKLSVAEQVTLFSRAEFVVGTTGASFTNLLYCQPQCKVLCISSYKADISVFSSIASFVGLDMQYYVPKDCIGRSGYFQDDFNVDIVEFEQVLKEFVKNNN